MEEKRRQGLYDFLSWKEKLLLYAAIGAIIIGSTALAVLASDGLESRLLSGKSTKQEIKYLDLLGY
jgi:hypothetical protein